MKVKELKEKVLNGKLIGKEEALFLAKEAPLKELTEAANEIRKHFCEDKFDICTIINENCKFCAQSSFYDTHIKEYSLLNSKAIVKEAKYNDERGVLRFSIVTSGRKLSDKEIDSVCESIKEINKNTSVSVCGSFGLLSEEQYKKLKEAGLTRVHNNLETSRKNFKNICTTHTFDEKVQAIKNAKNAGLNICSGGIMGLGETMEDRIDMALELRELGVLSIPVNILNPIKGTPFENNKLLTNDEICRIVAVYRFLIPNGAIRLAGGRGLLQDKGESCFLSGANAAISGDMLTTSGITIKEDMNLLNKIGYKPALLNE